METYDFIENCKICSLNDKHGTWLPLQSLKSQVRAILSKSIDQVMYTAVRAALLLLTVTVSLGTYGQ